MSEVLTGRRFPDDFEHTSRGCKPKMKIRTIAVQSLLTLTLVIPCAAQEEKYPKGETGLRVFSLPSAELQKLRGEVSAKVNESAFNRLRTEADAALKSPIMS